MKKLLAVLAVLIVMGTTSVFALGIGAQGGANVGGGVHGNGALTFKLDDKPFVFALDVNPYPNWFGVGLTADMWLANPKISGDLGYFYGWGLAGSVDLGTNYLGLNVGARLLAGLNFKLLDGFIELYVQGAWQPTLAILPGIGFDLFSFPVNGGIRFWF